MKKTGIKHLIECHCTLKIYQKFENTVYHKFPVYSKYNENNAGIISKIATKNLEKKKEPCLSFVKKINSEICAIVKKQLNLTRSKIINETRDKPLKDLTLSLQPNIDKKFKIKYLD